MRIFSPRTCVELKSSDIAVPKLASLLLSSSSSGPGAAAASAASAALSSSAAVSGLSGPACGSNVACGFSEG